MDSLNWLLDFHLLRPEWLLALIPLALIIWFNRQARAFSRSWASVIDARLLPHLLKGTPGKQRQYPQALLFSLGAIVIIALAGPAFEKRPQPVYKTKSALVILLDLSRSMDAADVKPSRLNRARFKVEDILKQRREGQTALITYAADAFVVSPLTEDADTIASQLPALETDIMPSQGSRLDIALKKAHELLNNAGHSKGHIFVLTDGVADDDLATIDALRSKNIITSILAVGTQQGAPIAMRQGGFVKDNSGAIVVPRLDETSLRKAAAAGGGRFTLLTAGDRDINTLLAQLRPNAQAKGEKQTDLSGTELNTDTWYEEGPWLLLLLIPFAAYTFRRGLVFMLFIAILPLPQPAHAFEWNQLWNNNDQRARIELEQGNADKAAELFNDPQWKAAAEYRAGNFAQAADLLNGIDNADAHYNRGNALAKAGQLEEAIEAYQQALQHQSDHADAQHNQQLVQQALQQQQQSAEQSQDGESADPQQADQQQGSSSESSQQGQQQDGQQGDESQTQSAENTSEQQNQSAQQSTEQDNSQINKETGALDEQQQNEQNEQGEQKQAMSQLDKQATPDLDEQQTQQWLKKIPDDPGGLLRRKFQYQYSRNKKPAEDKPW